MSSEFDKLRSSISKEHRDILDRFLQNYSKECQQAIKDEIERDKRHTAMVNMCAFAFSVSGPLASTGYHFISIEPLHKFRTEKGNKIFDLVIYSGKSRIAVLIETKSSVADPRREALNPFKEQVKNAVKHKRELEDEIGADVICGPPQDIEEVGKSLQDERVCLWSADLQYSTLKIYNPLGKKDSEKTKGLIEKGQLNKDPDLREKMYEKIKSTGQVVRILPSSHICRILSHVLVGVIQNFLFSSSGQEKKFWTHEIRQIVTEEMSRIPVNDVNRLIEEITGLAIKMKIIEADEVLSNALDRSFRLKMGTRSLRTVESNIEEQYVRHAREEKSPEKALTSIKTMLRVIKDLWIIFSLP